MRLVTATESAVPADNERTISNTRRGFGAPLSGVRLATDWYVAINGNDVVVHQGTIVGSDKILFAVCARFGFSESDRADSRST
jgi:hypothetical protein